MDIEIDFGKSLEENASGYFERGKLAKRKLSGLRKAMSDLKKRSDRIKEKPEKKEALSKKRKRHWFESFHWFRSSDGILVIGGKDAKGNEKSVKKHLAENDVFLHADIQGGAACIAKSDGKKIPKATLKEAAAFAAVRSKAWQQRLPSVDVYAASASQVSKKAPAGEHLATGAFMVYGKRQWFKKTLLAFAVGIVEEDGSFIVMGGPPSAVKKNCMASFEIGFGEQKRSEAAKQLLSLFEKKAGKSGISLDEIISVLPGEGLSIRE